MPTATGHLGAGDYWLSTDLNSSLEKIGYHTSQTYFNSYIKTTSQINIIMAGFLPTNNKIEPLHENTKNILNTLEKMDQNHQILMPLLNLTKA